MVEKYLKDKNNSAIIDTGANIGNYYQIILSFNRRAKILAFEPHPVFNQIYAFQNIVAILKKGQL